MTNSLKAFFSREAGQKRRAWLNSLGREEMDYALGPHADTVRNTANVLNMFNPIEGISEAMQGGRQAVEGEGWDRVQGLGRMSSGIAATVAPVAAGRVAGHGAGQMVDDAFDALVGWNPTRQAVGDEFSRFATEQDGGIRAYHGSPHDFDEFSMDRTPAQQVSDMLAAGRGDEVTDEMMAAVDPQEMFQLYESGATGMQMPMDEASRMARAREAGFGDTVYHGTTHEFEDFGGGNTKNLEGHFGAGDYFTTSAKDASDNYAGYGPDLTARIEQRAERIADEIGEDYDSLTARAMAKNELVGPHEGAVIPVRIRGDEVNVSPHTRGNPTTLEYDFKYTADDFIDDAKNELGSDADEWDIRARADEIAWEENANVEPEGTLADFIGSIRKQGWNYDFDTDEALEPVADELFDGVISANDLDARLRGGPLTYAEGENGELIGNDVLRQAFQDAGYPNIRMSANSQGWNMLIPEGTDHIISSDPTNIRSIFARFDPRLKHLKNLSAGGAGVAMLSQQDKDEIERYLSDF